MRAWLLALAKSIYYSTSVCFLPTYDFFAVNRGRLCFKFLSDCLQQTLRSPLRTDFAVTRLLLNT